MVGACALADQALVLPSASDVDAPITFVLFAAASSPAPFAASALVSFSRLPAVETPPAGLSSNDAGTAWRNWNTAFKSGGGCMRTFGGIIPTIRASPSSRDNGLVDSGVSLDPCPLVGSSAAAAPDDLGCGLPRVEAEDLVIATRVPPSTSLRRIRISAISSAFTGCKLKSEHCERAMSTADGRYTDRSSSPDLLGPPRPFFRGSGSGAPSASARRRTAADVASMSP
mmetsp:Transcript_669/g.1291  ORF Transcript_669/g.1291 Transcript_669/m.1291 type:complete len:227 (+) Transcript_669:1146-1826(+)